MIRAGLVMVAVTLCFTGRGVAQTLPREVDEAVRANLQQYRDGWLRGDQEAVMATLTNDAVLLPSGRPPLVGDRAIRGFWFPAPGPVTKVLAMQLDVDSTSGTAELAYVWGRGSLTFSFVDDGREKVVTALSTFVNVLRKGRNGSWKTAFRMWSDLPKP